VTPFFDSKQTETAVEVLTEQRREFVDTTSCDGIKSACDLAGHTDRDVSNGRRDLVILFEASIIEYEQDRCAKQLVFVSETGLAEPVVFEEEKLAD